MEREIIIVHKYLLRDVIRGDGSDEFVLIKDTITSSDPEDGGADHTLIIQRLSDKKYFRLYYSDWDLDYNFTDDFPEELIEVFPRQIMTTIYE